MSIQKGLLGVVLTGAAALVFLCAPASARADYNCDDFGSQAEAQEHLLPGDPDGLDADSDGIACESNPCPCSSGSGGESNPPPAPPSPPKPPPYRLKMRVAKNVSVRLVREAVSQTARLDYAVFNGCHRLGQLRIDCRLSAYGRTQTEKVSCQYKVSVQAHNRQPVGRIVARPCRSETLRLLTRPRAKAAMAPRAAEAAGKPTSLELTRLSQLMFLGYAEWTRPGPTGATESCGLEMTAELLPNDEVRIEAGLVLCQPLL